MKQFARCYACVYCQTCDKENEERCASQNYIMFTTEEQKEFCNLICGKSEGETENDNN